MSFWDWRPWAFMFCSAALIFWLQFGYFYYEAKAGLLPFGSEPRGLIAEHIGLEAIDSHFYAWVFGFIVSMAVIAYLAVKGSNSLINNRSIKNAENDLLFQIPTCTDPEIIEFNERLGITMGSDEVVVPLEILNRAPLEALARDLCVLFYLSYDEIKCQTDRGGYTAFHSLADLLLDNWPQSRIQDFIIAMAGEKDYIASMLEFALRRRSLDRQIDQLSKESAACREQERTVVEVLSDSRDLSKRFADYWELAAGKSAAVKWLKTKCRNFSDWFRLKPNPSHS